MSHFKLISSTKASDVIPVNKYKSEKTGITVIIANVEGPLVNGFFCLATEAHDDDGLPHTLEHLIFLGSERYPYKGILDLLANRCMAHGTNAWTDTDHTCYTIYTAGDAGMLTLLPIYLDHILRPTLTDHGFVTEVHHIDGEGEDAGVVYCEMQGRENDASSRCELKLLRTMYPNSGYSAETGGVMKNLRTSTNNDKVREFHKKFYRAENLTIILTGMIEAQDVFKALEQVEEDILKKNEKDLQEPWVKPWQNLPPPPQYGEYYEQWPADTEDCGQIVFGWRGPVLTEPTALKEMTACAVLLRYLCDTAAAPLQRCLVEREDALAANVSYNITENLATLLKIQLDSVPIHKLSAAHTETVRCMRGVRTGDERVDVTRVRRLVRKQLREAIASLEAEPHHAIAFRCIGDSLYSQNEDDFISRLNPQDCLRDLLEESEQYWLEQLQKYFTDDMVVIVGSPSIELQNNMTAEEKKRIEAQRAELGEKGLAEKAKRLQEAMEFNERPAPPGTLSGVAVASCASLRRHTLAAWAPPDVCPHLDLARLPMYTRLHSLRTNLLYINMIFDTIDMEDETRKWLPLLLDALGECPVRRGTELISHEQIVSTTEELTISCGASIGFGRPGNFTVGSYGNLVHLEIRCEPSDYEKVVDHIYEILYSAEITKERLLVFAQRLVNDAAQVRRNGHKMVYDLMKDSMYGKNSNIHWCSVLRQQRFLKELMERVNAGGDAANLVLEEARKAMEALTKNLWLHLSTDLDKFELTTEPWEKFAKKGAKSAPPRLRTDSEFMVGSLAEAGCVAGVGGVESAFVARAAPGPDSRDPAHRAPLLVAINYFIQLEGPMWRLIRGCGLAYSYGLRTAPSEGKIIFSLYRATNPVTAYTKAKTIIEESLEGKEFDEELFASAKSTAIFEVVESEKCPADVVARSLYNYLSQLSLEYNSELVREICACSGETARAAGATWLRGAFSGRAPTAIVCRPARAVELKDAFRKIGVELEAYESIEETHLNK